MGDSLPGNNCNTKKSARGLFLSPKQSISLRFRISLITALLSWKISTQKIVQIRAGEWIKKQVACSSFKYHLSLVYLWCESGDSFYKRHEDSALTSLCYPLWFPWRTDQRYSGKQTWLYFEFGQFFPLRRILNMFIVQNLIDSQAIKTICGVPTSYCPLSLLE